MDDDMYPNDYSYYLPSEPSDQVRDRKKEKAKALQGLDILTDMIERLEARIAFYESITSIPDKIRTDPEKFMIMHNTYSLVAKTLMSELEYLTSLLEEHAPNR